MAYKSKYKGSEIDNYLTKAKEMSETYPENVVQIEKNTDDIYGVDGKEIANSLTWEKGFWNTSGENISNDGNGTYNRCTTIDMTYIDKVVYSGLIPTNYQTSTNRAVNVVADGVIVKILSATSGELLRKNYPFKESLVLQISARTDKLNDVSIVITAGNKFAYKRSLDKSNENIETLNDIVVGCVNKEIISDAIWEKGLWSYTNDKGGGSYAELQTYRYSNKIDISLYDSVILSGLARIAHLSSSSDLKAAVAIYGDGQKVKMVECSESGAIVNIYRADYAQYGKLEIVVNAFQSEETYVPSVKVTKKGLTEGGDGSIAKRIVLCGDSLMGNDNTLIHYEFKQIAKSQGYELIRHSEGGEDIIGNLTRNGGVGIRVAEEFTIPISGSVDIVLTSVWMKSDGTYAQYPYRQSGIARRTVVICGIKGNLLQTGAQTYTFTRTEEGEAVKVGVGVIFYDSTLWDCRDYPHVWFTGQNGGYENEADWADMINSAARNFGENFIVCSTALSRTTNELVRQATKTFGDKYINLRAYTQGQAVYDGQRYGLIDSSYTAADYESLFWPGSDKVHQNNLLSYIWAVLMWNTLLDLGYVEGERIDTGEYYLE